MSSGISDSLMNKTIHKPHNRLRMLISNAPGFKPLILSAALCLSALFILLSLLFYSSADTAWSSTGKDYIRHPFGVYGAYTADFLLSLFGYAAYVIPFVMIFIPLSLLGQYTQEHFNRDKNYFGFLLNLVLAGTVLLFSLSGLLSSHFQADINSLAITAGGMLGQLLINIFLSQGVGVTQMILLFILGLFASLVTLFPKHFLAFVAYLGRLAIDLSHRLRHKLKESPKAKSPILSEEKPLSEEENKSPRLGFTYLSEEASVEKDLPLTDTRLLSRLSASQNQVGENKTLNSSYSSPSFAQAIKKEALSDQKERDFRFPKKSYGGMDWQTYKNYPELREYDAERKEWKKTPAQNLSQLNQSHLFAEQQQKEEPIDFRPRPALFAENVFSSQENSLAATEEISRLSTTETLSDPYKRAEEVKPEPDQQYGKTQPRPPLRFNSKRLGVAGAGERQAGQDQAFERKGFSNVFRLPDITQLNPIPERKKNYTQAELQELGDRLEKIFKDYRLQAKVKNMTVGPVATRFEIELAPGTKVSQISSIEKDLARSLAVSSVRIQEVIVGKSYIGLEIPNRYRETVYFRQVIDSEEYRRCASPLTMCLGLDIARKPIVTQLEKCPHLLVAGTTGSGKSVAVNVMLNSMLFKTLPEEMRLILIDPKMLEMSMYEDIPHLLTPVITDMDDAQNALRWAVAEMERRYQLMACFKVRNIKGFNQHIREKQLRGEKVYDPISDPDNRLGLLNQAVLKPLPHIVIVIDELADLMMVAGKKIEELIVRLAQKARAGGIHLILATQRPSVDVITGLIKANVPSRIAFQVSSKVDSRTILDQNGAETLLGLGDMLFLQPGMPAPKRVHGAFISDEEVERITDFLRTQGEPDYVDAILEPVESSAMGALGEVVDESDVDPLYHNALEWVAENEKVSISSLQRALKIGYNRAARMIEMLESERYISAPGGDGLRKVLKKQAFDED